MSENQENIVENTIDYTLKPAKTFKKFVVRILPEHIDYIDELSIEDRNELFNKLISEHISGESYQKSADRSVYLIKKLTGFLIFLLLSLPLIFILINLSIKSTQSSYKEMQSNFAQLYYVRKHK